MPEQERVNLRYALAWVYSRDERFSEIAAASNRGSIEDAYYEFTEAQSGRAATPVVPSLKKAWAKLNNVRTSGQLKLFGVAFILGRPHSRFPGETEITSENIELLGDGCSNNLIQPRGVQPVIKWEDVSVTFDSLVELFPKLGSQAKNVDRSAEPTKSERMVQSAIMGKWPDGIPPHLKDAERNCEIRNWIAENMKRPNGSSSSVSDSTINRFFSRVKSSDKK